MDVSSNSFPSSWPKLNFPKAEEGSRNYFSATVYLSTIQFIAPGYSSITFLNSLLLHYFFLKLHYPPRIKTFHLVSFFFVETSPSK